jgi:hypothetical protein
MEINIHIAQLPQSDGSKCYDVALRDLSGHPETYQMVRVFACSEEDAHAFAEKVKDLIDEHTITHVNGITRNY